MTDIANEQYINFELVDKLIQLFDSPTYENLSNILIYSIQFVGQAEKLPGETKKQMVINSLVRFVDISDITGDLEPVVLKMLPVMIDRLIAVDKHRIKLNPRTKTLLVQAWGVCKSLVKKCCCSSKEANIQA